MNNRAPFILYALLIAMLFSSFVPARKNNPQRLASLAVVKKSNRKNFIDNPYYIVISKKDYELKVYDDQGWFATYPCVFGSDDLRDKYMEGDKRTPDGKFR